MTEATLGDRERGGLDDRASDGWSVLLPLAQQFLDNQRRDLALRERALEREVRREQARALAVAQWRWVVVLCLAAVYLALLGFGAGLILHWTRVQPYVGNVNAPLLIVSHVGSLTMGILIGSWWVIRRMGEPLEAHTEG